MTDREIKLFKFAVKKGELLLKMEESMIGEKKYQEKSLNNDTPLTDLEIGLLTIIESQDKAMELLQKYQPDLGKKLPKDIDRMRVEMTQFVSEPQTKFNR